MKMTGWLAAVGLIVLAITAVRFWKLAGLGWWARVHATLLLASIVSFASRGMGTRSAIARVLVPNVGADVTMKMKLPVLLLNEMCSDARPRRDQIPMNARNCCLLLDLRHSVGKKSRYKMSCFFLENMKKSASDSASCCEL